jgi:hypothetical protein
MKLPIGYENFQEVVEKKLDFVDKTLFIKAVLDDEVTKVAVITRPRRFGKTFNLSMLHNFLAPEIYGRETHSLFDNLKIARCGDDYMRHQGKYPVVSISFKDIKQANFEIAFSKLYELIMDTYNQHSYLETSHKLNSNQKDYYRVLMSRKANQAQLENSLQKLTEFLYIHHGLKPWVLIDEYDTPIQSAYINGYYQEMIDFIRGIFSTALKTNPYLERGVITGILRIAKESLFSGLNNLKVYSLLNSRYSEYFGFTEVEVDALLQKSGLSGKSEDIKQWYNGYRLGDTVIYNPWSIVNYIDEKGLLKPFWINTSDNQLIKDLLKKSDIEFKQDIELLLEGKSVEKLIDEQIIFQYLNNNPSSVWSLLLMSGYLKPLSSRDTYQGTFVELSIPNKEVHSLYREMDLM